MDLLVGLRRFLLANASIDALVTASGKSRIYTPRLPEKLELPAIQMTYVSDVGEWHLRGANNLRRVRVQLDCWATTRDAVYALGRLVRQRLNGYQGDFTDGSGGTIRIQLARLDDAGERFEEDIHGGLCRHSADYFLHFTDANDDFLI